MPFTQFLATRIERPRHEICKGGLTPTPRCVDVDDKRFVFGGPRWIGLVARHVICWRCTGLRRGRAAVHFAPDKMEPPSQEQRELPAIEHVVGFARGVAAERNARVDGCCLVLFSICGSRSKLLLGGPRERGLIIRVNVWIASEGRFEILRRFEPTLYFLGVDRYRASAHLT